MEEMAFDLYKNNVIQELNKIRRKIVQQPLSKSEVKSLNQNFQHPSFVATNSRNTGGVNYLISLYAELAAIGTDVLGAINNITEK